MGRTDRAFQAVSDVAIAALEANPSHDPMQLVVEQLVQVLSVDACVFHENERRGWSRMPYVSFPEMREWIPTAPVPTTLLATVHPGMRFLLDHRVTEPLCLADIVDRKEWAASDYAAAMRSKFGRSQQLAIPVATSAQAIRIWAVTRDGNEYTPSDRDVAEAVQPILDVVTRHHLASLSVEAEDLQGLTQRELVVLRLLAEGLAAQAVARRLGIAAPTVNKHLEHIYRKLGVRDRLVAVQVARQLGLLPDDSRSEESTGEPTRQD